MSSPSEIRELKELFTNKKDKFDKATQGVKQSLETVELNNQWKTTMFKDFQRRLSRMEGRNFDYNFDDNDEDDKMLKADGEKELSQIWFFLSWILKSINSLEHYKLYYDAEDDYVFED